MQSDKMNTRREKIMYQVLKLSMPQARVEKKIIQASKRFCLQWFRRRHVHCRIRIGFECLMQKAGMVN